MLKILVKIFGFILLIFVLLFGLLYYFYNEPLPTGESGPEADALANRMLDALNSKSYQNAGFIEWSYRGGSHTYKWDKNREVATIGWDDYVVNLDLITPDSSIAFENGERLPNEETQDLIADAQSFFNNDSFWLVAPFKVFDRGSRRYLIDLEDGSEGLLVTYTQGGDTPGDSYLWILEPSGIPKSFKLWVKIIPINGLEASWDGWKKTESGALLPSSHKLGPITLSLGEVKAYNP